MSFTFKPQPTGGSSGLEKLTIKYEKYKPNDFKGRIEALFNPSEFQISQSLDWETKGGDAVGQETAVRQQFNGVNPKSISIELFFDTYENHKNNKWGALSELDKYFPKPKATTVQAYTQKVAILAQVNEELHRPPICKLSWGKFKNLFTGVLTQFDQKFTMFMPSGMPVRATVTCAFIEHQVSGRELHSADVPKRHTVAPHDTLHSIAAEFYNNPNEWRRIAQANQIVNPRQLNPGMVLFIPTQL